MPTVSKTENDMVKYSMQKPPESLSDYVRFFWTLEANVGSMVPFVHRALPRIAWNLYFIAWDDFR